MRFVGAYDGLLGLYDFYVAGHAGPEAVARLLQGLPCEVHVASRYSNLIGRGLQVEQRRSYLLFDPGAKIIEFPAAATERASSHQSIPVRLAPGKDGNAERSRSAEGAVRLAGSRSDDAVIGVGGQAGRCSADAARSADSAERTRVSAL